MCSNVGHVTDIIAGSWLLDSLVRGRMRAWGAVALRWHGSQRALGPQFFEDCFGDVFSGLQRSLDGAAEAMVSAEPNPVCILQRSVAKGIVAGTLTGQGHGN